MRAKVWRPSKPSAHPISAEPRTSYLHYQFDKQRSGAVGIDNLNNNKYWNNHLYPGRTLLAELKWTH